MVRLIIDGQEVQVAEGTNLVDAAAKLGIEVPTYCYHPGLSVVGQCRICFVEVEGLPRLVTACSTQVRDDMVVHTASERVREARAAVMEFLLENHPLDCPVCDQAGECLLQDYSVEHGADTTHMVDTRRTFPGLERRLIGPHVVQNQNRCIHCTRCVRFTREVSQTHDLTMKSRGNHAFIDTFDGRSLDNPWSACVADVCPVGALTVKEFRFRARVWSLDDTSSVCPGCSIGCNIFADHRKSVIYRFRPRHNLEINGWWMCDHGRFLAEGLNARDIETPLLRLEEDLGPITWSHALERLDEALAGGSRPKVVASANLSNEALFLVKKLLAGHHGLDVVIPVFKGSQHKIPNARKEWVASIDGHPNSTGARLLGLSTVDEAGLREVVEGKAPLIVLDSRAHPWLASDEAARAAAGRELVVVGRTHTALSRAASLVLPGASWLETEGTFTSSTGRVQLARRGFHPSSHAKPMWELLTLVAERQGVEEAVHDRPRSVFEALAAEIPAFAGMTYRRLETEPGIPALEEVHHVG